MVFESVSYSLVDTFVSRRRLKSVNAYNQIFKTPLRHLIASHRSMRALRTSLSFPHSNVRSDNQHHLVVHHPTHGGKRVARGSRGGAHIAHLCRSPRWSVEAALLQVPHHRQSVDDEVEDEEGNGDGTDGRPIVFGGAA